jgi:hypothetical protein
VRGPSNSFSRVATSATGLPYCSSTLRLTPCTFSAPSSQ